MANTLFDEPFIVAEKPRKPKAQAVKGFELSLMQKVQAAALRATCLAMPRVATEGAYFLFTRPRRKRLRYLSSLPAGATRFQLPFEKTSLVGYSWGTGPKKVLLMHGWEGQVGTMLKFVEPLVDAGYQVIAMDGPGHGESGNITATVFDCAKGIELVMAHFGGVDRIIAHSFGSAAALFACEDKIKLDKLVCISPMATLMSHVEVFHKLTHLTDEVLERLIRKIEERLNVKRESWNMINAAQKVTCPTLIVHDADDKIIPIDHGYTLVKRFPQGHLVRTQGLGHKRILKDPDVVQKIVEFLEIE